MCRPESSPLPVSGVFFLSLYVGVVWSNSPVVDTAAEVLTCTLEGSIRHEIGSWHATALSVIAAETALVKDGVVEVALVIDHNMLALRVVGQRQGVVAVGISPAIPASPNHRGTGAVSPDVGSASA